MPSLSVSCPRNCSARYETSMNSLGGGPLLRTKTATLLEDATWEHEESSSASPVCDKDKTGQVCDMRLPAWRPSACSFRVPQETNGTAASLPGRP